MAEDRENTRENADRREELELKDLVLDEPFLTSWEASLKKKPAPKGEGEPGPAGGEDRALDLDELLLDVSALEGLEPRGSEIPEIPDETEAGPAGEDDDLMDMEDMILDEVMREGEDSAEEIPEEGAGEAAPDPPAPEPEGDAIEKRPGWRRFFGSRWAVPGILAAALVAVAAAFFLAVPLLAPPEQVKETPVFVDEGSRLSVEGLFLPLEKGKRGLYVSISLSLEDTGPSPEKGGYFLREAAYDAAGSFSPEELATYHGMKALKARIAALLKAKRPGLEIRGINFTEYMIL